MRFLKVIYLFILAVPHPRCCVGRLWLGWVRAALQLHCLSSYRGDFSYCRAWAQTSETARLSSCGPRTQLLPGMWDLPGPGIEPTSPVLVGGSLATGPPGKPFRYGALKAVF